jgi:putative DNA methylase
MNQERIWHSRGYLPHFEGGEKAQFITIRLNDSLPQNVLRRWQKELEDEENPKALLRERIETFLDQGYGKCHLRKPDVASMMQDSLLFGDSKTYRLLSWVVMPNHVHFLIMPIFPNTLSEILHSIKSYTAKEANKLLNRTGTFWQIEYFDRYIRDDEHYQNTFNYIQMNPVKAKLCQDPRN